MNDRVGRSGVGAGLCLGGSLPSLALLERGDPDPGILGGVMLGDEGDERDGAGQRNDDDAPPGPADPTSEIDRGDDQDHVEPAVRDTGDIDQAGIVGPDLQRNTDAHQDDQQTADDVGHHPISGQSTAHDYYLMS